MDIFDIVGAILGFIASIIPLIVILFIFSRLAKAAKQGQKTLRRCSGKGLHLAMTGEPRRFSRVTAGFSSYDGEFRLPLVLALPPLHLH